MKIIVTGKSKLSGIAAIPGSKSHTVRAAAIGSLASGTSHITNPLDAADTRSALACFGMFGAETSIDDGWRIEGNGGDICTPENIIDVGNSGTTLYMAMAVAALGSGITVFTGDSQIRRRPAGPLIEALNTLGARVESTRGNDCAPIIIKGPLTGGEVTINCSKTSQYLSSLLIACPLSENETTIHVEKLVERPYVEMTLDWLDRQGIKLEHDGLEYFKIPGRQSYSSINRSIPADYSSATFLICSAVLCGGDIKLTGLDQYDTQGDKAVIDLLRGMGSDISWQGTDLLVRGSKLLGAQLDLGDTPDALPALAVTSCFSHGTTHITNVAQARAKETDRIAVMAEQLKLMGAEINELPDGLVISGSCLHPAVVNGCGDHRVIMSLAIAGMAVDGETVVENADAVEVTFPTFVPIMKSLGANIRIER